MQQINRHEVHEALACLYGDYELGQTALARRLSEVSERASVREAGTRLRTVLLTAIASLRPSRHYAFASLESRSYDVLSLRYVENWGARRVADELSLSLRQVHRDLAAAERKLASVLSTSLADDPSHSPRGQLEDELLALRSEPVQVSLQEALMAAIRLVEPLALQHGITVAVERGPDPATHVVAERSIVTQVLAQLLSCAVKAADPPGVSVGVSSEGEMAVVTAAFSADGRKIRTEQFSDARDIASTQGMKCDLYLASPRSSRVVLRARAAKPVTVLVVEDNPGAIELYRRYLSGGVWQLHALTDPQRASALARSLRPDAIILDIMMPGLDGWTVLRNFASQPETADIPVIICSVVQDAELSRTLGACAHLRKPVARGELLAALNRCLDQRETSL